MVLVNSLRLLARIFQLYFIARMMKKEWRRPRAYLALSRLEEKTIKQRKVLDITAKIETLLRTAS